MCGGGDFEDAFFGILTLEAFKFLQKGAEFG